MESVIKVKRGVNGGRGTVAIVGFWEGVGCGEGEWAGEFEKGWKGEVWSGGEETGLVGLSEGSDVIGGDWEDEGDMFGIWVDAESK